MNWHNIKRKIYYEEILFVIVMTIVLLVGGIDEMIVHLWAPKLYVLEYDSVSLVVIQIQATIQTLTIALLALATGKMNESYMGINYNDFHFNIRPSVFTQKRIIIESVLLLMLNVFLHMAGFYNFVVAVFIVVCILILISVKEIYAVFTNQNLTDEEIEAYLLSFASVKIASKKTIEAFKYLCRGWREEAENLSTVEYEKYLSIYKSFFDVLIFDDSFNSQMIIEKETSKIIKDFSKSTNQAIQVRSLSLLNEYYKFLSNSICENKEKAQAAEMGTHVLHETYFEVSHVISSCSVSLIESVFSLTDFIEDCVLCNYCFGYKDGQCYELRDVEDLVLSLCYQLGQEGNQDYNDQYWGKVLAHIDTMSVVWLENLRDKLDATICNIKFVYAQMLIRRGHFSLVKDYFYEQAVQYIRLSKTKNQVKLFLKVHCYLFYLAFYETTKCISELLIEAARKFLDETKRHFKYGLEWVAEIEERNGNNFVFDKNILKDLWIELRPFELFPKHEDTKMMIMEAVVNDFIVFVAIYLSDQYYNLNFLFNIISAENEISLYMRFFHNQPQNERFIKFLKIVDASDKNPEILLSKFEKILKNSIKSTQMFEAQKDYAASETNNVTRMKDDVTKKLFEHLNQTFKVIISESAKDCAEIRIPVLRVNDFSDSSLDKVLNGKYDSISQQVITFLCSILCKLNIVKVKRKSSFADDKEYLEFLKSQEIALVIGSQYALSPKDYKNKNELESVLDDKVIILEGYYEKALLLEASSLNIYFQNINIGVHSAVLADDSFLYDPSKDLYTYEVINGIPIEFTKDELIKYIHDKRRIVDIVLKMNVQPKSGIIGYLLTP